MSSVFARSATPLPVAATGLGSQLWDETGRRYLDGSGGAVVVGVGHGDASVIEAVTAQLGRVGHVHATKFTTEVLENYAAELAALLPMDDPRVYPVSGGSEAVETALKMARGFHLARGQDRPVVIARHGSYHGNSRGALSVSGRAGLRRPYLPWLGATAFVPAPYEYRCPFPAEHPHGCPDAHERALVAAFEAAGPDRVAAFVAEPVSGATLGACVPTDGYWPMVRRVCDRFGALLIADEVMTGFGRTGRWFGCEHWDLRPDIMTAGKGAASGYWPLGLAIASGRVHDTLATTGFVHGFTFSHHPAGAAAGLAVLRRLRDDHVVDTVSDNGSRFAAALRSGLAEHPRVGDIRGIGLLWAVELVADRADRTPFPRRDRVTERVVAAAAAAGLLVYSATGCATGTDGDLVLLGPPLTTAPTELDEMAALLTEAVHTALPV